MSIESQGGIPAWPAPADGQRVARIGVKSVGLQGYQRKDAPAPDPE